MLMRRRLMWYKNWKILYKFIYKEYYHYYWFDFLSGFSVWMNVLRRDNNDLKM